MLVAVTEDAQARQLPSHPCDIRFAVSFRHRHQREQAGADLADHTMFNSHVGGYHALDNGNHLSAPLNRALRNPSNCARRSRRALVHSPLNTGERENALIPLTCYVFTATRSPIVSSAVISMIRSVARSPGVRETSSHHTSKY